MGTLKVGAIADTGAQAVVKEEVVPENEYLALTIAKHDGKGGYKPTQQPYVHYANIDTGA